MRETTNRERRLGILFGTAIFILVNLLLLVNLKKQGQALQRDKINLESRQTQASLLLKDQEYWETRSSWMDKHKPLYPLSGDAQTDLVEMVQKSAGEYALDATPPVLEEPKSKGLYEEVSANMKVTGDLRAVVTWLAQIQQPGKFQSVSNLSLQADKTPGKVICEVRVAKWFFLGTPPTTEEEGPPSASRTRASTTPGVILLGSPRAR